MRRAIMGIVVAVAAAAAATAARADGDPARGHAYARAQCADCHAVERRDGYSPGRQAASFVHIANTPGMTAMALSVWLQTPHPTMPNLIIAEADRRDVVAYIESLRKR